MIRIPYGGRITGSGGGGVLPVMTSLNFWLSDEGSDPSVWSDKSTNGYHSTQADSAKQPTIITNEINGRQIRRFDGYNDYMLNTPSITGDKISIFIVAKTNSQHVYYSGGLSLYNSAESNDNNTASSIACLTDYTGGADFCALITSRNTTSAQIIAPVDNEWSLYEIICESNTMKTYCDGILQNVSTNTGNFNINSAVIGARWVSSTIGYNMVIDIAEIIAYNDSLGDSDRQLIETYVNAKYGFNVPTIIPTDISDLQVWLKDDGSDASVWTDNSGNGYNATQANSAYQPAIITNFLNGKQVRLFDGSNDFLQTSAFSVALAQPVTIFVVASIGGNNIVFDGITSRVSLGHWSANTELYAGGGAVGFSQTEPSPVIIYSCFFNSANSFFYANGGLKMAGSVGSNNMDGLTIGYLASSGGNYLNGDVAEIIVFKKELSKSERKSMQQYLNTKYARY